MAAIKITQKVIIVHGKSDPYDGRTVKIKMVNGGYLGAHFWYDKDKRDVVSAYLYSHNSIGCGNTWKIKKQGNGYIFQIVKGHHGTVPVHHYLSCEAYFGKDTRDNNACGRSVYCAAHQWHGCAAVFSINKHGNNKNQFTLKILKGNAHTPIGYNVAVHSFYGKDKRDATSTYVMAHSHSTPAIFELIDQ